MCEVDDLVDRAGRGRLRPQSPLKREDAGVAMAWYVGYGVVAESDERYTPVEVAVSNAGWGRGRGKEKRRDDCSSRAVGELSDLDMAPG